jgi:SAM-dependent methyltransferase
MAEWFRRLTRRAAGHVAAGLSATGAEPVGPALPLLAADTPESRKALGEFRRRTLLPYQEFHTRIFAAEVGGDLNRSLHPDDTFTKRGKENFVAGHAAVGVLKLALWLGLKAPEEVRSVLDFGGGFGRVTRFLRRSFPNAEVWHCDIDPRMGEFVAREFGARTFSVPKNIGELEPSHFPARFDLIWLGSIFTHTSRADMLRLLGLFAGLQDAGGIIVFTTDGQYMVDRMRLGMRNGELSVQPAETIREFHETGHCFRASRPAVAAGIKWGRALYSRAGLDAVGREVADRYELIGYMPRASFGKQDVTAYRRIGA